MKLTYWYIQHQHDSDIYSIRARTKREALDQVANHWNETDFDPKLVKKVTVEYDNALDLLQQCSEEGHHWWESTS